MSEQEVAEYLDTFPPEKRPANGEALARELVRDERLSTYQAKTVLEGSTTRLVLGEYVVVNKIGKGGMGQVFKARHRRTGRVAAIKVLRPDALQSKDAAKRFLQEVQAANRLNHRNIVATYDAGCQDGVHYLVMEYVDGQDLAALVQARGPVPLARAIDYVLQAARGLEYAHGRHVVHRDIKPANLLLDSQGTIKILDMGLARITEADEGNQGATLAERLTRQGQMLGTVDYVSPEQAADTRSADHRSDIYSLGCTLFRLLTGKPVYEGETAIAKLLAHCESRIPSLSDLLPEVPESLQQVFFKMVAKKPEDRYQSMTEVIAGLEACLASLPAETRRAGGAPAARSRLTTPAREQATGQWQDITQMPKEEANVSQRPPAGASPQGQGKKTVHVGGKTVRADSAEVAAMIQAVPTALAENRPAAEEATSGAVGTSPTTAEKPSPTDAKPDSAGNNP